MENIGLRFRLAAQLNRMRYGDRQIVSQDDAQKAWPPTGDHDRSFEGAFRAMALANGGNRPETSYTTQERIQRDLDETFDVVQNALDGDWVIRRRLSACPHCRGEGFVRFVPRDSERAFSPAMAVSMEEVVTVETRPCDHRPAEASAGMNE